MAQHIFYRQFWDASDGNISPESIGVSRSSDYVPVSGGVGQSSTWPTSQYEPCEADSYYGGDRHEDDEEYEIENEAEETEPQASTSRPFEPLIFEVIDPPDGYTPLTFRPKILTRPILLAIAAFYLSMLGLLGYLIHRSRSASVWTIRNVNYYLAARYLPAVVGVCTQTLYRTTASTLRRMLPFIHLADQRKPIFNRWMEHTICARYFPLSLRYYQTIWFLYLGNFAIMFTIATKATLFDVEDTGPGAWQVSVRLASAEYLAFMYLVIASINVFITIQYASCSTGLKEDWDPTSLADIVLLFTPMDKLPDLSYGLNDYRWHDMVRHSTERLRLGYWMLSNSTESAPSIIYGIRVATVVCLTIALIRVWSYDGIVLKTGAWAIQSNNVTLPPNGTAFVRPGVDFVLIPGSFGQAANTRDFLAYILFRLVPITIVGWAGGILTTVDVHHRWVQPFTNMYEKASLASGSLLLDYMTVSPLEVIPQAWANKHYRVVYFGMLNALNWVPPLIMTGLCAVTETGSETVVQLSPTVACLAIICLSIYIYSLISAWAPAKRRLPRDVGSLYDYFCFFYDSQLRWFPEFGQAAFSRDMTKDELHSLLRLAKDEFRFGLVGDPQNPHPGFDVAEHVTWIAPVPGICERIKNLFRRRKSISDSNDNGSDSDANDNRSDSNSEYDAIPLQDYDDFASTHHRGPLIRIHPSNGHSTAVD
ncbi:hypothetical protein KCU89_g4145, partial [Aureobasidium melanogenum]